MNAIELALEKQRLRLEIAAQRQALAEYTEGLKPAFEAVDQVRAGFRWLSRHPEAVAGGVTVLVVARPRTLRFFWRWTRRGFFAWRLWRESGRWLGESRVRTAAL
jgi:hypothetical protein